MDVADDVRVLPEKVEGSVTLSIFLASVATVEFTADAKDGTTLSIVFLFPTSDEVWINAAHVGTTATATRPKSNLAVLTILLVRHIVDVDVDVDVARSKRFRFRLHQAFVMLVEPYS